ncbi:hypothetical protein EVAR_127_1 [Eumeta japonica]|uniref:RNA-directed DNA polymerase from mobile element jockey n=1 Tax=Eumeta variegata TaxID=151549 RepID=A0A4C1SAX4_EUMVA|nr:hypothetical protein EVAR_127_1 [Eumeta japonica]
MGKLDLFILYNSTPTRRTRPHSNPKTMDLLFYSPDLAPFLSWEDLQDSYDSDHFPIIIKLLFSRLKIIPLLKYKLTFDNWNGYRDRLDYKLAKLPKLSALDPALSVVGISSSPWWDHNVQELLRREVELKF